MGKYNMNRRITKSVEVFPDEGYGRGISLEAFI